MCSADDKLVGQPSATVGMFDVPGFHSNPRSANEKLMLERLVIKKGAFLDVSGGEVRRSCISMCCTAKLSELHMCLDQVCVERGGAPLICLGGESLCTSPVPQGQQQPQTHTLAVLPAARDAAHVKQHAACSLALAVHRNVTRLIHRAPRFLPPAVQGQQQPEGRRAAGPAQGRHLPG